MELVGKMTKLVPIAICRQTIVEYFAQSKGGWQIACSKYDGICFLILDGWFFPLKTPSVDMCINVAFSDAAERFKSRSLFRANIFCRATWSLSTDLLSNLAARFKITSGEISSTNSFKESCGHWKRVKFAVTSFPVVVPTTLKLESASSLRSTDRPTIPVAPTTRILILTYFQLYETNYR